MAIRSVVLLCASSLLAGAAARAAPPMLSQGQLHEPAAVAGWLKEYGHGADRDGAALAHAEGVKDVQRRDFGAAVKGFGESALRYPSPQAILAYTDAQLRFLGGLRAHNKNRAKHQDSDLRLFESLYRSALASNAVLATMNASERRGVQGHADCIAAYRRAKAGAARCAPLLTYGLQ